MRSKFNFWVLFYETPLGVNDTISHAHNTLYVQASPSRAEDFFFFHNQRFPRRRTLPNVTSVPMRPGDAVVVRQPEVHMADGGQLADRQWRLAISIR